MTAIALGGAAFLIWLSCKALSAHVAPATVDAPPVAAASWQRNFATGLATHVLKPKATLFFVALFTAIVTAPLSPTLLWGPPAASPLPTFGAFASPPLLLSPDGHPLLPPSPAPPTAHPKTLDHTSKP